ncbi:MAG: FAD-binding oxidoreductase [Dehalococcoidia bacterium]|nr:FAD-binding oxidoreductase [Dehalococcoidia bacterium]
MATETALKAHPRQSIWMFGLEADEPTEQQRGEQAAVLAKRWGVELDIPPIPRVEDLELRAPRIKPPDSIAEFCLTDNYERALHSKGDRLKEIRGQFDNPPDVVAHPRTDQELEAVLEWCSDNGYAAIPYGGGSSSANGVTPPDDWGGIVTIDMDQFDQVLEIDETSRSALIQAGTYGPALEDQLRPHGYTLRHFPQSFAGSTLGGWVATRSGGHFATNHTHIDDFVESTRMLTPSGWWESRRLPGSGAGPSPDRLVVGSEGSLGVITEAWMRIQKRPEYRATAGVTFPSWEAGYEATRRIVQAKLWPANLRLLDPELAQGSAGMDGDQALLVIGFESAEISQDWGVRQAVEIARDAGGVIDDADILTADAGQPTGRGGAVGAWRDAFIPSGGSALGIGTIGGTVETSISWERWPEFDRSVRAALLGALKEICGGGTVNCRFTHVYTDGPAPYYTYAGLYRPGLTEEDAYQVRKAGLDAFIAGGATVTHHHAVGRLHRPWYDQQRPELFASALRAAKLAVDPNAVLNPGVLIDM